MDNDGGNKPSEARPSEKGPGLTSDTIHVHNVSPGESGLEAAEATVQYVQKSSDAASLSTSTFSSD